MRLVDTWDVIAMAECRRRFDSLYKNEHHGDTARQLDIQLRQAIFEQRKRVLLGNDHEDQDWALMYLREARASMN